MEEFRLRGNFACRNLPRPCSLVPLCEGKWRDHPYVLHRLKMSDCNKIIRELQCMYASPSARGPGVAPVAPAAPPSLQDWTADVEATLSPIGELLGGRQNSRWLASLPGPGRSGWSERTNYVQDASERGVQDGVSSSNAPINVKPHPP